MQGNMQQLKGSWNELLGKAKEHWGNLTDDDLNVVEGNIDQLIGRIQKRTGEARNAVSKGAQRTVRRRRVHGLAILKSGQRSRRLRGRASS